MKKDKVDEAYYKRKDSGKYVVPMKKEQYKEWNDAVEKGKEQSRGYTGRG